MDVLKYLKTKQKMQKIDAEQRALNEKALAVNRDFTADEQERWDDLNLEYSTLEKKIKGSGYVKDAKLMRAYQKVQSDESTFDNEAFRLLESEVRARGLYQVTKPDPGYDEKGNNDMYETTEYDNYKFDSHGTSTRDAFNRYLLYGERALSASEFRALQGNVSTSGGYLLTPTEITQQLLRELDNLVFVRRYARILRVEKSESLRIPKLDPRMASLDWTSEIKTGAEDDTMGFTAKVLYPHPCAKRIKVSNDLLKISSLDPEGIVRQEMESQLAMTLENSYISGTGVDEPLGVMTQSDVGIDASRDVSTGNTTTSVKFDGLMEVVGSIRSQYRAGCRWVISRDLETKIRKLKDGEGRYIWEPSAGGRQAMLLGYPVDISEYIPTDFSAGKLVGIFGNFDYYYIVDCLQFQVQKLVELYAETNQTGYVCRYSGDGAPMLPQAFARIQLAT